MKTTIYVSFNYGAYALKFKKSFDFNFTPFFGMRIVDYKDGEENVIELKNNEYYNTTIDYEVNNKEWVIDVRNIWRGAVDGDAIDYILKLFKITDWERTDNTDISHFKEITTRKWN